MVLKLDADDRNADWTKDGVLDLPGADAASTARWLFDNGHPFSWLAGLPAYPTWAEQIPWIAAVEGELEKLNAAEQKRTHAAGVRFAA